MTEEPKRPRMRPAWWPEGEPWPPARRMRPGRFFGRIGCAFLAFNLLGLIGITFLALSVLRDLGVLNVSINPLRLAVPAAAALIVIGIAAAGLIGLGARRIFSPLDDLLAAADRVARGDYAVTVVERGPREVRSLARAFNNMASRLHRLDEQRRAMLADVTHELRTPLTVMRGNLEGMLDGVYPVEETRLRALLEETDLLTRLVEDLRTLALAESGALQLRREPTDLPQLARETLAAFTAQAEAGGVQLVLDAPDGLPAAQVDAGRIRQVLGNLISNALRYTPSGGQVRVTCAREGSGLRVAVRDSGPGIPEADLAHVFERFYRSADSGGMGLGLAIARSLVEAHGGSLRAENVAAGGAELSFTLP